MCMKMAIRKPDMKGGRNPALFYCLFFDDCRELCYIHTHEKSGGDYAKGTF